MINFAVTEQEQMEAAITQVGRDSDTSVRLLFFFSLELNKWVGYLNSIVEHCDRLAI